MISLSNLDYINTIVTLICIYIITHKQTPFIKQLVDDKIIRTIILFTIYYISRSNMYVGLLLSIAYFNLLSYYSNSVFIKNK